MNKINIIQFLPYFPPHKWGLETHAQERGKWREKKWYWDVTNVVFDLWYFSKKDLNDKIILIPALEIIPTFPIPKFWKKDFREATSAIARNVATWQSNWKVIVVTRTRFFTSSLLGWLFAKKNKLKRVHIEHGSDYVKLSSRIKNIIARIYDQIIWRRIFKKANQIIPISKACQRFVKRFTKKETEVIYRGLDFINTTDFKQVPSENFKNKFSNKIIVWFIGRIYKWKNLDSLIKAYYSLDKNMQEKIMVVIIWDGPYFNTVKKLDIENQIYFAWWKEFKEAILLQKQFDIQIHSSSPWGWIASTVLQALYLWPLIVATPYEWADEVIEDKKNGILLKDDNADSIKNGIIEAVNITSKRKEFSELNKKIVDEKFSRNQNIQTYFNLLK